jgi:hypothetical protein
LAAEAAYPAALFPSQVSDCSAIHLTALASLEKPSILSTCPLGHVASTIHPIAGGVFLRAAKVGRGSVIGHSQGRDPSVSLPKLNVMTVYKLLAAPFAESSSAQ